MIDRLKIMQVSDLHDLSKKLYDKGTMFEKTMDLGDGKVMHYIEEVTDALVDQVLQERPDVLFLCGDLSYNGELLSHEDLVSKLMSLSMQVSRF